VSRRVAVSFLVAAAAAFVVSAAYRYAWQGSKPTPTTPQERRSRYAAVISWIGGYGSDLYRFGGAFRSL
jgi:hypothetical protein